MCRSARPPAAVARRAASAPHRSGDTPMSNGSPQHAGTYYSAQPILPISWATTALISAVAMSAFPKSGHSAPLSGPPPHTPSCQPAQPFSGLDHGSAAGALVVVVPAHLGLAMRLKDALLPVLVPVFAEPMRRFHAARIWLQLIDNKAVIRRLIWPGAPIPSLAERRTGALLPQPVSRLLRL